VSQSVLKSASAIPSAPPVIEDTALARIITHCKAYRGAALTRSIGQLALNLFLYAVLIAAMFAAFSAGAWWATLLLALPAGGILVRLFIIQHDCGHGSFFQSKRANHAAGWLLARRP